MSNTPENKQNLPQGEGRDQQPSSPGKKRWFGRGIYGSKDVPIRVLDIVIVVMILAAVGLTVWNAVRGGFVISFETGGADTQIADQKVRYGSLVEEPETPTRPGYTLDCWSSDEAEVNPWIFSASTVESDMTLYAVWTPAEITVKFDLDGGTCNGSDTLPPITVTYGEAYGPLPSPVKDNATFTGWVYSGQLIAEDTPVTMTGEHVLTATWSAE